MLKPTAVLEIDICCEKANPNLSPNTCGFASFSLQEEKNTDCLFTVFHVVYTVNPPDCFASMESWQMPVFW